MQNLTIQKLCIGLIALAFFIAAPWITTELLEGNSMPVLVLGAIAAILLFVYGLGDRCWLLIPFCLPVEGNLNFLPLNFSLQETAIIIVFCYLLFRMIFGLDVGWRLGPAYVWVPLAGLLAVILYHWVSSGDIGIKLLGGTGWGGRKYFKVLIAIFCLPLLASFPGMKWKDLQKVPLIYFLGCFVDIVPQSITTVFPSAAPYLWRVYSGVNIQEYGATLLGNFAAETGVTRIGSLGKLGMAIGLLVVCYVPGRTWLNPNRFWAIPVVLLGGLLCAVSGFRNTVVKYVFSMVAGLYGSIRWYALVIFPILGIGAFAAAFTQGKVFEYPLAMQRALSFLPGDWSPKAKVEADASSDWRGRMKKLFYDEYFEKNPVFGVGYHFNPEIAKRETDIYLAVVQRKLEEGDEYADVRGFMERREPHEGLVHALLVSGIVGTSFFIFFCGALLGQIYQSLRRTPPRETTPIQTWAVALNSTTVVGFFLLGGDYTSFLISVCPVAMLLYRESRLRAEALFSAPMDLTETDGPIILSGSYQRP